MSPGEKWQKRGCWLSFAANVAPCNDCVPPSCYSGKSSAPTLWPKRDALLEVEGRELVRVVQERVGLEAALRLVVVRNGQLVLVDAAQRFQTAVEYADDVVARLRPDARTPDVVMDPRRAFGRPAIRGVRTESLAEDYRAGTGRDELVDLYDLTPDQVDEALRFELIAGSERAA